MADTEFSSSVHSSLVRTAYARKVLLWAQQQMYFKPFIKDQISDELAATGREKEAPAITDGSGGIITRKSELVNEAGDKVRVSVLAPLSGEGVVDDADLEGNEESMTYYTQDVTVHQRRNAVRSKGKTSLQRAKIAFREDAKASLGNWLAQKIDTDIMLALSGLANAAGTLTAATPSSNRRWVGGQTTGGTVTHTANDLDAELGSGTGGKTYADMLFGTKVISTIKRKAEIAGSGYPGIQPLMIKGKRYYLMFVHPWQAKALKEEAAWINAQKDANIRGEDNPLFSGALGEYDGVIIHSTDKVESRVGDGVGTDGSTYFESSDAASSSSETICRALFVGAQAGLLAIARNVSWDEKKFDYSNKLGIAVGAMYGVVRTEFNSEDFATIAVDTCVVPD